MAKIFHTKQIEDRFTTSATLVYVDERGKPCRLPADLRRKLSEYEASDDT